MSETDTLFYSFQGISSAKKNTHVKVHSSKSSNDDQKNSSTTRRKKRTAVELKEEKKVGAIEETDVEGVRTIEIILVPVSVPVPVPDNTCLLYTSRCV